MRQIFLAVAIALCLLTCSCTIQRLRAHTEYRTIQRLASIHVGTPDPRILTFQEGQQLVVSWNLCPNFSSYSTVWLDIYVRYGDHTDYSFQVPLDKKMGRYIYSLLGDEYCSKQGIESYRVDLFADGILLDQQLHPLWVERIVFEEEKTTSR